MLLAEIRSERSHDRGGRQVSPAKYLEWSNRSHVNTGGATEVPTGDGRRVGTSQTARVKLWPGSSQVLGGWCQTVHLHEKWVTRA
jgi:hypothetical protein